MTWYPESDILVLGSRMQIIRNPRQWNRPKVVWIRYGEIQKPYEIFHGIRNPGAWNPKSRFRVMMMASQCCETKNMGIEEFGVLSRYSKVTKVVG